jgi:hemolysin activation/secretion protein
MERLMVVLVNGPAGRARSLLGNSSNALSVAAPLTLRLAPIAFAIAVMGAAGASAYAQSTPVVPTPEQAIQEGLRRQEERSRDQQRGLEPQASELSAKPANSHHKSFPVENNCFGISGFVLGGKDAHQFSWILDAARSFAGRCVGVQGLSFIASALDAELRDRGLATTRVSLPPQNLQGGILQINLEVGRVAAIRMERSDVQPAQPDDRWGTWRNAFPLGAGDVLNVRDLEQGLENMKRLPSQNVATRLEPAQTPGSSVVVIGRNTASWAQRLHGGVTVDNTGSASLGRTQLSANLALDNPLGVNDLVSVSLNTNAEHPTEEHRSLSASINYSVPWGYNLLTLSASKSAFAQYIQGTTVRFLSSGNSETAEARLQHTAWRNASSKIGVYAALSTRAAKSYLDDTEIIVQRRQTSNVEAGASYKRLFEKSSLDVDMGYRQGVPGQGAQDDLESAAIGGLTLRPAIWTLNANYNREFDLAGRGFQYSATLRYQGTHNLTLSIDQMGIGGRSSVRGFDGDAVLLAENGVVLRNELTTGVQNFWGVQSTALLAIDYGQVWGPSDVNLAGKSLAGMAVGLRGRRGALQFDALLATPLSQPSGFHTAGVTPYLSITYAI